MKENSSLSLQKVLSNVYAQLFHMNCRWNVYLMDINGDYECEKFLTVLFDKREQWREYNEM